MKPVRAVRNPPIRFGHWGRAVRAANALAGQTGIRHTVRGARGRLGWAWLVRSQ